MTTRNRESYVPASLKNADQGDLKTGSGIYPCVHDPRRHSCCLTSVGCRVIYSLAFCSRRSDDDSLSPAERVRVARLRQELGDGEGVTRFVLVLVVNL